MKKNNKLTRRNFLEMSGLGAAGLILSQTATSQPNNIAKEMLLYIGTYTNSGKSEGIYVQKFNLETGQLTPLHTVKNVFDPSFLAITKSRKFLYAVNETEEFGGKKSGAVSAFAIDQKTGNLQFLNQQPSLGGAPCHITVSDNEKFVLVANYVGGNVTVLPIEQDGKLGVSVDVAQHSGSSVNLNRQLSPHAHSINLDKKNRFAIAADLGADKVFIYEFDVKTGKLNLNSAQNFYQPKLGAGPRHFTFHQNGKLAFVINELDTTISSLGFDEKLGTLTEIQTVPTLPAGVTGASNSCADVHVSPNAKFLYGSNRGHNSIVSFKIDDNSGKLEYIEHTPTQGKKPRNFAIDPTGNFLLVANQDSDSIIVFRVDQKTGKLHPTGFSAQVPVPVCLKFVAGF